MARQPNLLPGWDDTLDDAPARPSKPTGSPTLTVTELSTQLKNLLENTFTRVAVQGEISGLKHHSSGHVYLDLKDEAATLNAVAWRSTVARWPSIPTSGTLVIAHGKLTTYPARSNYQLIIDKLEPAGLGAMLQQLEALKAKLQAEGLFDTARKRPLPFLPRKIGLITSPTGAVLADMLHRLAARCPRPVVLWPVAVQGPEAPAQIAAAIAGFNQLQGDARPDVLIIARGGGSLNDLMAFNTEVVARAVAGSAIPTISGVGHEPDVTLCDHAADVRAPTPTAAAELVAPVREDLLAHFAYQRQRIARGTQQLLQKQQQRLRHAQRLLPDPQRLLLQATQRLTETTCRLHHYGPRLIQQHQQRVQALQRILAAHNPRAPLQRGFALVRQHGQLLTSAQGPAGPIELEFHNGRRAATLT